MLSLRIALRAAGMLLPVAGLGLIAATPSQGSSSHRLHRAHRMSTPPDSYLKYKVYSVDQLVQQLKQDPAVRARFAEHFGIPANQVVSYMQANLVESYVPVTGRYTVYCMKRDGRIYPVRQRFRSGTKVFALRNGSPVMKWVCGNPLSKFLPFIETKRIPVPPIKKVSPFIGELVPSDQQETILPVQSPAVYQPSVPIPFAGPAVSRLIGGGGTSLLPFLLPVGIIAFGGGGGGSHGTPPPAIVPEPNPIVYVLAALPLLGLAVVRRRRSAESGENR